MDINFFHIDCDWIFKDPSEDDDTESKKFFNSGMFKLFVL